MVGWHSHYIASDRYCQCHLTFSNNKAFIVTDLTLSKPALSPTTMTTWRILCKWPPSLPTSITEKWSSQYPRPCLWLHPIPHPTCIPPSTWAFPTQTMPFCSYDLPQPHPRWHPIDQSHNLPRLHHLYPLQQWLCLQCYSCPGFKLGIPAQKQPTNMRCPLPSHYQVSHVQIGPAQLGGQTPQQLDPLHPGTWQPPTTMYPQLYYQVLESRCICNIQPLGNTWQIEHLSSRKLLGSWFLWAVT